MTLVVVLVLAAVAAAAGVYLYVRSRSEIRSIENFKNGLEKISPEAMPEVPPESGRAEEEDQREHRAAATGRKASRGRERRP
jgi:hypothetical protein